MNNKNKGQVIINDVNLGYFNDNYEISNDNNNDNDNINLVLLIKFM